MVKNNCREVTEYGHYSKLFLRFFGLGLSSKHSLLFKHLLLLNIYDLLSLYNFIYMYVFRADYLFFDNQLVSHPLGKTVSFCSQLSWVGWSSFCKGEASWLFQIHFGMSLGLIFKFLNNTMCLVLKSQCCNVCLLSTNWIILYLLVLFISFNILFCSFFLLFVYSDSLSLFPLARFRVVVFYLFLFEEPILCLPILFFIFNCSLTEIIQTSTFHIKSDYWTLHIK